MLFGERPIRNIRMRKDKRVAKLIDKYGGMKWKDKKLPKKNLWIIPIEDLFKNLLQIS